MTDNTKYWVWLSLALGVNNAKQKRVYELYDSIKEFYDNGIYEWRLCGFLSDKEIDKLSKTSLCDAIKVIDTNTGNISGNTFTAGSTKDEIKVEICSECHPFYTGKQKNIEAGGRIDKFKKRFKMD